MNALIKNNSKLSHEIADDKLAEYSLILNILHAATEQISHTNTFEQALQCVVDIVTDSIDWDIGHAYALDIYSRKEMVSTPIWHLKHPDDHKQFCEATNKIMRFKAGLGLPGMVLKTGKAACIHNIQDDPDSPRRKLCKKMSVKGAFAFPVIDDGVTIAVLEFFSIDELTLTDNLVNMLSELGKHMGSLLARKHIEKSLKDQKFAIDQSAMVSKADIEGLIFYVNDTFCKISQYDENEILGKKYSDFIANSDKSDKFKKMWGKINEGKVWKGEIRNQSKDGSDYWLSTTIVPLLDEKNNPYEFLTISYDITEQKHAEQEIEKHAFYDTVTDLPNRRLFKDHLNSALGYCERFDHTLAIVFIDVDNFKRINDTFGHKFGDRVLKVIAEQLSDLLRKSDYVSRINFKKNSDVVSRLGGDEFTLLLTSNIKETNITTVIQRIKDTFSKPIVIDDRELTITISVGISMYPNDGKDAETLLKNADAAMYHVKGDGKNDFRFYDESMNKHAARKLMLEHHLRKAIESNTLELHYQPKVNLKTGLITSHEALLRWNPNIEEIGNVYPDEFIKLAEETNLIVEIGKWVLQNACRQNKQWQEMGCEDLTVAVNVSMRQFRSGLVKTIMDVLEETKLAPECLEVEITESTLMVDFDKTFKELKKLHECGVKISIDDFGTGYSSLRYLQQLPIDALKIDRSFIMNCPDNEDDVAISKTIISLAKLLKLQIIAEGVETNEQFDFVKIQGCDFIQGYLISKPKPVGEIEEFMRECNMYNIIDPDNKKLA